MQLVAKIVGALALLLLLLESSVAIKGPVARTRGTGWGFDSTDDINALSELGWWYNWDTRSSDGNLALTGQFDMEYVAMQWGRWGIDNLDEHLAEGVKVLLGFNEPNHAEQAALLPAEAAALWPQLQAVADTRGMQLGAPAAAACGAHCTGGLRSPFDWWDQFFSNCTGCRVDFLATHYYGCDAHWLAAYLQACGKYGLPVWVTELDCPNGGGTPLREYLYMLQALDVLDSSPSVERYAWFAPRTRGGWIGPTASLLNASSPTLTALGRAYLRHGVDPDFSPRDNALPEMGWRGEDRDTAELLARGGQGAEGGGAAAEGLALAGGVWDWQQACAPCAAADLEDVAHQHRPLCEACGYAARPAGWRAEVLAAAGAEPAEVS